MFFRITHLCFIGLSWLNPHYHSSTGFFIGIITHQLDFYGNCQHVYTLLDLSLPVVIISVSLHITSDLNTLLDDYFWI